MSIDIRGCITEVNDNSLALYTLYGLGVLSATSSMNTPVPARLDKEWFIKVHDGIITDNKTAQEYVDKFMKLISLRAFLKNSSELHKIYRTKLCTQIIDVYYGDLKEREEFWEGVWDGMMGIAPSKPKYFMQSENGETPYYKCE